MSSHVVRGDETQTLQSIFDLFLKYVLIIYIRLLKQSNVLVWIAIGLEKAIENFTLSGSCICVLLSCVPDESLFSQKIRPRIRSFTLPRVACR